MEGNRLWWSTLKACRWTWEPNLEEPKLINAILILERGGFQQTDLTHRLLSPLPPVKVKAWQRWGWGERETEEKKAEESQAREGDHE